MRIALAARRGLEDLVGSGEGHPAWQPSNRVWEDRPVSPQKLEIGNGGGPHRGLRGIIEQARRYSHYRQRDAIQVDRCAEDAHIAAERLLPQSVSDDRDAVF